MREGDTPFATALVRIAPVDQVAGADAAAHHDRLTKPRGSLGRLEDAGVRLAAIARRSPPPVPEPASVAVFAADHGVLAERVSPWPREVTAQMVANFGRGGAAISVLARHAGARVVVVDVGVASDLEPYPGLAIRKVRPGTANLAERPAMTKSEAEQALDVGAEMATQLVTEGARCLVTGDMGIGNTTPSAALVAAFTGRAVSEVTGRGTGIDDPAWARKVRVVETALARAESDGTLGKGPEIQGPSGPTEREVQGPSGPTEREILDPLAVLAALGGLEIAALAGFIAGGAAAGVPVIIDGVVALAALLPVAALCPDVASYCFAGHRSTEPGASAALTHLGLEPLLDLELRLGEGTGACLALPVLQAAAKVLREMATFDQAGVTEK